MPRLSLQSLLLIQVHSREAWKGPANFQAATERQELFCGEVQFRKALPPRLGFGPCSGN
jgi:hypothetical protein